MNRRTKLLCEALKDSLRTGSPAQIPAGGDHLWRWFLDLHGARSFGFSGPNPISFVEIRAYLELLRIPAEPHHVEILRALDSAYLEHAYASRDGKGASKPAGPLSAESFDAFFG
ncbi:phage tail assembly chaperone [Neorhizobium sp. DAR64860/K0K1]|uniref:phage tail assembly chaperone n=1 Tax=Neorhizobium sp. DAR64860/K0K1 TaxID=3421955 RepID=UPI003D2D5E36